MICFLYIIKKFDLEYTPSIMIYCVRQDDIMINILDKINKVNDLKNIIEIIKNN